ncbi:DUF2189 domain-containing protein [Motiliproteus coralliicola]|uniref:DUF2189 domain-containing protein n=1 Tax=Motiliproteus coralliicola TaxID=2283196 RepID=A0A369WER1_9GAMM|nr:DUF2189 domain-containing protein [Motiliproteus coralliicola]RDE19649.1 DUF2189 domain-containing protein [Motiliproteus coralliicola]
MTAHYSHNQHHRASEPIQVRRVDRDQPFAWLAAGWRDFITSPGHSLLYGASFTLFCGVLMLLNGTYPGFLLVYLATLLIVGPLLALGTYTAAWQLENGFPVSISESLSLILTRLGNLALLGFCLLIVLTIWVKLSALILALQAHQLPTDQTLISAAMQDIPGAKSALILMLGLALLLLTVVFVCGVAGVPLIVDRNVEAMRAIRSSIRTVLQNPLTMLCWALMILVLFGIGVITGLVLMPVLFPVLGYASWHCYEDLIE